MPSKEQERSSLLSSRLPDELIQRLDRSLAWWETSRRVKASRHAVLREALSPWREAHAHEAGLVHAPTLRHPFWNAVHRLAQGPHAVRIHRLRQTLPWPRERCDAMVEARRAEPPIVREEARPGAMSARDIHDSSHGHGRLSLTLHWRDGGRPAPTSPAVPARRAAPTAGAPGGRPGAALPSALSSTTAALMTA
jgi:hypothetical protein